MYAYVSRGKGEQRTDRACLEIRLYREIGKRTCIQAHVRWHLRGKGKQRTDRACLDIRLSMDIEKRTCI